MRAWTVPFGCRAALREGGIRARVAALRGHFKSCGPPPRWRHLTVTERHATLDYASFSRTLFEPRPPPGGTVAASTTFSVAIDRAAERPPAAQNRQLRCTGWPVRARLEKARWGRYPQEKPPTPTPG